MRDLDALGIDGDQPGRGQGRKGPFGDRRDGDLGVGGAAADEGTPIVGGQPQQNLPRRLLLVSGQLGEDGLCPPGQRAGNPAGPQVGGDIETRAGGGIPGLRQGGAEQGEWRRQVASVVQDQLDEAGLDRAAHPIRRAGDDGTDLCRAHRAQQHSPFGERVAEPRMLRTPGDEVCADRQHHAMPGGAKGEQSVEPGHSPNDVVLHDPRLLELVDHDDRPTP